MMSGQKKRWRGLALAVSVVILAEGVARMPVLGASGSGEQTTGISSEIEQEGTGADTGTDKTEQSSTIKNVIPNTGAIVPAREQTANTDGTEDASGTGTDSESSNTDTDSNTNHTETGNPDGSTGGNNGSGNSTEGNTGTGNTSGSNSGSQGAGTGSSGDTGTGTDPAGSSGSQGTGTGSSGDTGTGTDSADSSGSQGTGTGSSGDTGTGTGTSGSQGAETGSTGSSGDQGTGADTSGSSGNQSTGGNSGTGSGDPVTGGNTSSDSGDGSEETDKEEDKEPAEEQKKYTVELDGNKVSFDDFAEMWSENVDGKTVKLRLEEDIEVTTAAGAAGPVCTLTSGNVELNLNGRNLTYKSPASRNVTGSPDLIEVSGGSLTIKGNGRISYNGSGNYSGACLYVSGGELNIEDGTFSSTVSAPVCVDGAVLNIKGGTFRAASDSGSAITMNNGKLNMSGGEVILGSLTLTRTKSSMDVELEKGSKLSRIESKGGNDMDPFTVSELLALDCGYRSYSGNSWITDENMLSGTGIRSVSVDKKPIRSVTLSASPDQSEVQFSYNGGTAFTLTADVEMASGASDLLEYEWYRTYNGGVEEKIENTGNIYRFSTTDYNAGTYEYHVGVKAGDYEEWDSFTLKVNPLPDGVIINRNYQTEYTYGDFVAPAPNGGGSFTAEPAIPEAANVEWVYRWYKDSVADDHVVNTPSDVGTYILRVEAGDANYRAVGEIPVTITQRTVTPVIEGTTSKVYDGTTEAKDVQLVLDNVVSGDAVGVKAASIAYNDANARLANRITASGIELTGSKAGNYRLSSTQASVEASITKARLQIQMSVSPNTQKINRPVTVTVTALNSDNSPMENNGLKAEDIVLAVSGRNDEEAEHTLPLTASGSQYGVYTAEYTTGIKGDKTFTAAITGNANYEVSNIASDNTLTILDKTKAVMNLTASETENLVYGDEVTYTAVVSKENEDDADALIGNVQFYEDEIADNHRIGSAQSIVMSGDKASITLDNSTLTAGDHKILAVFSGSEYFEDVSAEVSTTIAKKQLTWDASGLSASKAAGISGEVTVYGELKLDGLVDEGDVTFKQPDVLKTNGLKSTEAGSYKVTVVSEDKKWEFDPEEPENYELPEGDPEITARVNAVKELPNPPADTEDGKKFKLVMEEGISTVPEGLMNTSFNTPQKIEQELKRVLTESGVYKEENTAVYDVVLQVSTDEGNTWEVADYTNFPSDGLLVTLPYPGGTGRYTNNYAVAHMFASSYFGKTSGQIELPAIRKTDNGMEFTVTGLSPIGLAWSGPTDAVNSAGGGAARRIAGAVTWDDNPILLYAYLAGGAVLAIVIVVTACVVRSRKKKKKKSRR